MMNWIILGLTALAIAIVAIRGFFQFNKNWDDIYVKRSEDRAKEEACNITNDVPRAEYRVKDKINKIQDKELGKLLMLGKNHMAKLAQGKE